MPALGNQFKNANSFRETTKLRSTSKEKSERETTNIWPLFIFNDRRVIKITGLFFLVLSLYFMVAFTSYLFTWQDDQSYVLPSNGGWSNLFKSQKDFLAIGIKQPVVQNWLGKLGGLLAHQFIYEWFGIASFVFIGIFFIVGYRLLFKVKIWSIQKSLAYCFFLLVFISIFLGYAHGFVSDYPHYLEGEFGFWTNRLLREEIGNTGTAGLLIFAGLSTLIIAYNIEFTLPKWKWSSDDLFTDSELSVQPKVEEESEKMFAMQSVTNDLNLDTIVPVANTIHSAKNEVVSPVVNASSAIQARELEIIAPSSEEVLLDNLPEPIVEISKPEHTLSIEETPEEKTASELVEQFGTFDPKLDLSGYKYPTLDLLEDHGTNKIAVSSQELEANKNKIVETLNHYNIEIDKIKATIGPTVTLYEIIPAPGVRIAKIKNLEDDIALSLAALGIRIIAPMPGKGTIGIEVPNRHPEMVSMRSILATEKFQNTTMDLPIALGKTISNEVYIADLAKMPHLLVAGATGQGKSVGINALLVSLLYKLHPSQLKFVLVDPKKVELTLFRKIERHFLAKLPGEEDAIITDTKKVIATLNSLCIEMDQRYDLLKNAQVRNLKEYNQKFINRKLNPNDGHRFLPFIVLIIDEFADLMMTAGKEVETPIARLAQLARAVGIHLVIATQRPSVNIITGTIKANFPARIAFRVLSKIDSRTILDVGGADQLIGRGDLLLSTGSDLIRIQCAFVDTPEVERISDYIGGQRGYSSAWMLPEYVDENGESGSKDFDAKDRDPLFEDAARLIVMHQQGSTSLIQRKLKLGYNRSGRIIDQLEAAGVVGPFEGSKAREVLFPDEYSLEEFLSTLN